MIATVIYLGTDDRSRRGWRGFAQPGLQGRYSVRLAAVGLGVAWTLWYAPLFYLVVLNRRGLAALLAIDPVVLYGSTCLAPAPPDLLVPGVNNS